MEPLILSEAQFKPREEEKKRLTVVLVLEDCFKDYVNKKRLELCQNKRVMCLSNKINK